MRKLLVLLLLAPSLAAAVGPELPVSPARVGEAVGRQNGIVVAQDLSRRTVAIWTDSRRRGSGIFTDQIMGSRVDADGNLLDPAGIPIGGEPWLSGPISTPALLPSPLGFTAIWGQDQKIWARRLDRDGRPTEPARVLAASLGMIAAASNYDTVIVLTHNATNGILVFDTTLEPIRSTSYEALGVNSVTVRIANLSTGEYLLVGAAAIGQNEVVSAIQLDSNANVLARHATGGRYIPTALEWTGKDYLLAWKASTVPTGLPTSTEAQRLGRDGAPVSAPFRLFDYDAQIDIAPFTPSGGDGAVLMAWTPSAAYLGQPFDVYAARIDGTTLGARQTIAASASLEVAPAVFVKDGRGVVLWSFGSRYEEFGIDTAPVDTSGRRTDGGEVAAARSEKTESNAAQVHFATLRDTPSSLAMWSEDRGDAIPQVVIRDLAGDAEPRPIAPSGNRQILPAMATNGETLAAVWAEVHPNFLHASLKAIRLRPDGTALDAAPITVSETPEIIHRPAVAWNGSYYLIAYTAGDLSLHLVRMTAGGLIVDDRVIALQSGAFPLLTPPPPPTTGQFAPVLVPANGDVTFLVWQNGLPELCATCGHEPASSIEMIRIAPGGTPMDSEPITIADGRAPDAAWDGSRLVVVWKKQQVVHATRISVSGTAAPSDRAILIGSTVRGAFPAVGVETPGSVVIAWEEADPSRPNAMLSRIVARRMRGAFLEEARAISSALPVQRAPFVWAISPRVAAVGFERVIELVDRLRYVVFDPVPPARVRAVR